MSKRLKTVLLICALFCLSLFGAVFAACTPTEDQPGPEPEPSTKTYSVTVTDTDGVTLSGMMVQMCVVTEEGGTGLCTPAATNANGVATFELEEGKYHIELPTWSSILAQYPDASYEEITTEDGVYDYTIVIDYGTTSFTYTVQDEDENPVAGALLSITVDGNQVMATTNANGQATLRLASGVTADPNGYNVSITCPPGYVYNGDLISTNDENKVITVTKSEAVEGNFGERKNVFKVVTDPATGLSTSEAVPMYFLTNAGEFDIHATDGEEIYYTFQTMVSGTYKIEVSGDDSAIVELPTYNNGTNSFFYVKDGASEDTNSLDFEVTDELAAAIESSYHTFAVTVTSDNYPVDLKITITRTGDPKPPVVKNNVIMKAEELPEVYEVPQGLLLGAPLDSEQAVLGSDGFYHVGSETGPYLLAKLVGSSRYMDENFENVEFHGNKNLQIPGPVDEETNTQDIYMYINYSDTTGTVPEIDPSCFIAQYSDRCNGDGVVRITEELALFLQRYAGYMGAMGIYQGAVDEEDYWLIPCYYYQTDAEDVAFRDVEEQAAELDGYGYYKITIPAGKTGYIRVDGFRGYEVTVFSSQVSALYDGETYSASGSATQFGFQTTPDQHNTYYTLYWTTFGLTNTTTGDVTVEFSVAEGTFGLNEDEPFTIVEDVQMGVTYEAVPLYYEFTPATSGVYAIRAFGEESSAQVGMYNDELGEYAPIAVGTDGFLVTLQLTAREPVLLQFGSQLSAGSEYSFVVTKVDAIADGSGTEQDPYVITKEGDYALVMPEGAENVYFTFGEGFWSMKAEDYGFTYPVAYYLDSLGNVVYAGISSETSVNPDAEYYYTSSTVILTVTEAAEGTQYNPFDLTVGTTTAEYGDNLYGELFYLFTAEKAGTYTLYTTNTLAQINVYDADGGYMSRFDTDGRGATYAFEAVAGTSYTFSFQGGGAASHDIVFMEGERPVYEYPESGSGTEDDPYIVSRALIYRAEIAANGSTYYEVSGGRYIVTIEDVDNAKVVYNGETYLPEDGILSFTTEEDVNLMEFTTTDGAAAEFNFSLDEYEVTELIATEETELVGTLLQVGDNEVKEGADFFTPAVYYFIPMQSGEYRISGNEGSVAYFADNGWGVEETYYNNPTIISVRAGSVYQINSYAAGTVTIEEVDVAYDSFTGDGVDTDIMLGSAGSGIGAYEITIASGATLNLSYNASVELKVTANSTAVSATYNGMTYRADGELPFSFTSEAPLGRDTIRFTLTNDTNSAVTIVLTVSQVYTLTAPGEEEPEGTELELGENIVVTLPSEGETQCFFTADEAGTYVFSSSDVNLVVNADGGNYMLIPMEGMTSFEVVLDAGESIMMVATDYNWGTTAGECTLTIEKA